MDWAIVPYIQSKTHGKASARMTWLDAEPLARLLYSGRWGASLSKTAGRMKMRRCLHGIVT